MENKAAIRVDPNDNVLVALKNIQCSEEVAQGLITKEMIPAKQKLAAVSFDIGDEIKMYGVVVGSATKPILAGQLLSTENVAHKSSSYTGKTSEYTWKSPDVSHLSNKTFEGYHRPNGKIGTANHWIFVPLVFCESRNLEMLKNALRKTLGYSFDDPYTSFAQELRSSYEKGINVDSLKDFSANYYDTDQKKLFENNNVVIQ